MAKLNSTTIQDVTNKMSLGVLSTTNDKNYFEEMFKWSPQLDKTDIFANTIPTASNPTAADANVSANPTLISKLTDYQIDELPASNAQGYSAFATPGNTTSLRLQHFLTPQKYGNGYGFILKDSGGTVLDLTTGSYQMDYHNGILRFNEGNTPTDMGWSTPLTLTAYRYIGDMLADENTSGGTSDDSWRQPVRVLDTSSTVLTGWSADPVIDGVTLVSGDIVLFTALTIGLENDRKYIWDNVGLTWTLIEDGQDSDGSPQDGDRLLVKEGTQYADVTFTFNGTDWVETSNFNLFVGEADETPLGANINRILVCPGTSDTVFIDDSTAYLHAPEAPNAIEIENTITRFSGRISQGNINYGSTSAGDLLNYISRSTDIPTSNTFSTTTTSFNNASIDQLNVMFNGGSIGALDLAINFNETNRGGSQILADYDLAGTGDPVTNGIVPFTNAGIGNGNLTLNTVNWTQNIEANVYQKGSATVNVSNSALFRQGYNSLYMTRGADTSSTYELFLDTDVGADPSVASSTLTEDVPVVKHLSGVPYYDTGATFNYGTIVSNGFNNVYHSSNAPVVVSGFPGVASTGIVYSDPSVSGVTTPPTIGDTMTIAAYTFTVLANQEENNVRVTATPQDPYGTYISDITANQNISIMSIPNLSDTTYEYFVDENYRFPRTTNFDVVPGSLTGNWTGTTSLSTLANELQVYDESGATTRGLAHPSVDYSSGRLPVGPDYSGLAAGTDYDYHRIFQGTIDNSNGIIDLPGITDVDLSSGNVKIDIKVPTKTDWISLNSPYTLSTFEDNVKFVDDVWSLSTDYSIGDWAVPTVSNGYKYKVTVDSGSSGATEPVWGTTVGGTTVDGGITWTCYEIDSEEGCRINSTSHSPSIDGSVEFTLGTYSSDSGINRTMFVRITYASNTQSSSLLTGLGISNW